MPDLYCTVCDRDHTTDPALVLARWQNQTICLDCLDNRPGKEEAEAEARGQRPLLTQQAYRAHGWGLCPRCQSGNHDMRKPILGLGIADIGLVCRDCELSWSDLYRLVAYVRDARTPAGEADWAYFFTTTITEEHPWDD